MDMGTIAALKKIYKYLLLKSIIAHHDLSQDAKDALNQSALQMWRGTAKVDHGKPEILYDAAEYALEAWADLSEQTLNDCFIQTGTVSALKKYDSSEEPENFDDFLAVFHNCPIRSRININTPA